AAINDLGQVVGVSQNDQFRTHAFIWDRAHGMRDLGPEPGQDPNFYDSTAVSINNRGQVLLDLALWTEAGGMQSLASLTNNGAVLPGLLYVIGAGGPHSINDGGQLLLLGVVGFTTDEFPEPIYIPLRWDP